MWIAVVLLAFTLAGCGAGGEVPAASVSPGLAERASLVDVYLVGDAGKPAPGGDPVLIAAERAASRAPERSWVVFLGDNLYPEGIPEAPGAARVEAERILQAQLAVPLNAGARAIFVAGNHDWDRSGPQGWAEARLQEDYLEAHGGGRVEFLPDGGCPGPAVRDLPGGLRLLALDTQWWLHPYDKPRPPPDACPAVSDSAVIDRIQAVLRESAGRPVVVLSHHPMVSGGTHGVFPLLPTRFSPRPRFSAQDLGHPRYRHMRAVLRAAFAAHPPLVHAAGHDHNLQLLQGVGSRFQVVSGTGIYGHTGPVRALPGTLYRRRASGFVRLSLLADRTVRMDVFVVNVDGSSRIDDSRILSPAA